MQRDRKGNNQRAFQQVPRSMRRRGASHNAKKVPKRLRKRAEKEMRDDNTPTVNAKTRPKSRLTRLRLDKAKKLVGLNSRLKQSKKDKKEIHTDPDRMVDISRVPKSPKDVLKDPPKATTRFKKRQVQKTWLPTHLWHAKRARMPRPTHPLWRMAVPLEPSEKSYRPTHRAGSGRGAIAWDTSYISTISCVGAEEALSMMLESMGLLSDRKHDVWKRIAPKWKAGTRTMNNWAIDPTHGQTLLAPVTVLWCPRDSVESPEVIQTQRQIFLRVHPSAFLQLWNLVLRLAKEQSHHVSVEDLRWEIGSIEITGPASTEALSGVLKPVTNDPCGAIWNDLSRLSNPASMPYNAILSLDVLDPRLQNPPHITTKAFDDPEAALKLATLLAAWPPDKEPSRSNLFSKVSRHAASKALPSQKSINRRRTLAPTGHVPAPKDTDPQIPVILMASKSSYGDTNSQGTWTILLPWKCVDVVWRRLLFYPLSSGSTPRFGGLKQQQQLAFEKQEPWFPGDFPGTEAGDAWARTEDEERRKEWEKRPPGRRVNFQTLKLANGEVGEIGRGWTSDWQSLAEVDGAANEQDKNDQTVIFSRPLSSKFRQQLSSGLIPSPSDTGDGHTLGTIRITFLTRGTPLRGARIYTLPSKASNQNLQKWLALDPGPSSGISPEPQEKGRLNHWGTIRKHTVLPPENIDAVDIPGYDPAWDEERKQQQQNKSKKGKASLQHKSTEQPNISTGPLLSATDNTDPVHPPCPPKSHLIGFVTTGAYNLSQGRGTAIGSIWLEKYWKLSNVESTGGETGSGSRSPLRETGSHRAEQINKQRRNRLIVVRNSGECVGRLGIWEEVM
ncbi:putative ribonuclease p complex subunit [Phaeomoniella chlamydospora]|uniref:Putative ribonuclease p complex subunit n=1 Tax=Phaeomoniella chlamydospora TaxID=158046 RepID=A0A0G2ETF4_PHACM|nr:putative ribonuclease p complex subunit [Phaeomoniella chlamydospora]